MNKKYGIDFLDMIDGWCRMPDHDKKMQFDDIESAKKKCKKLNKELDAQNKSAGEHFSVIDLENNRVLG